MSKLVEEWRPVVGYEGYYEVSDWGNVRSLGCEYVGKNQYGGVFICRKNGKILNKALDSYGYHVVTLYDSNHKHKTKKVHRLVADAFIPNLENKPIVGHTKTLPNGLEDKTANEVWNLAWMSIEENNSYGTLLERQRISHSGEKCYNFGKHLSAITKKKLSEIGKRNVIKRTRNKEGKFLTIVKDKE